MVKSIRTDGDGMFRSDIFISHCKELGIDVIDRNQELHELINTAAYIRHLDNEWNEQVRMKLNEKAKIKIVEYKPGDKFMYRKNMDGKFSSLYQGPFIVLEDLGTKVTFKSKSGRVMTASKAKIKRFLGKE
uniref:Uncharacterized protein n=1 Tax=Strongyloides stercoralis TaxID=6248 RepID=A0AAF5DKB0_STRER